MENKNFERLDNSNYIYLNETNSIIYCSDFDIPLGHVSDEFRFVPNGRASQEQGLTPQMLVVISNIIRKKAGIGEKRFKETGVPEK
jgi:hypothetical protein